MPTFSKQEEVWVDVDVDISVEAFYDEMDSDDKIEMLDLLRSDEDPDLRDIILETGNRGFDAQEFEKAIHKLINNYDQLTTKEADIVVELAKRFI
jgi:hypothetical protein